MYYLQSRYYDPAIGRFINSDYFVTTSVLGFLNYNMFAYCLNNPVNLVDYSGNNTTMLAVEWSTSMWWLTIADGLLPIGDFVYWAGLALIGTGLFAVDSTIKSNYYSSDNSKSNGTHNHEEQTTYVAGCGSAAPPPQDPNNNNKWDKQKNGTPKNNQAQNKQAHDAAKKAKLSKQQQRILHDEIHGQNLSYKEIEEIQNMQFILWQEERFSIRESNLQAQKKYSSTKQVMKNQFLRKKRKSF